MLRERRAVADDAEVAARARQRDVEPAQFRQEADFAAFVAADERQHDGLLLTALQSVDRADLQSFDAAEAIAQQSHLRGVGSHDCDLVGAHTGFEQLLDVLADHRRFALVATAAVVIAFALVATAARGVEEEQRVLRRIGLRRRRQVGEPMAAHGLRGHELAAVERRVRPFLDAFVHAVLRRQHARRELAGLRVRESFEQRRREPALRRFVRMHGGGQLAVVAGEHCAVAEQERHPARGLERLRGFVENDEVEAAVAQQLVAAAGRRREHDVRGVEQSLDDRVLQRAQFGTETTLLAFEFEAVAARGAQPLALQVAQLVAHVAHQLLLRRFVHLHRERLRDDCGQHANGLAESHDAHALLQQSFGEVVDGDVGGRAREHGFAARYGLSDHFDDRRGLAGSWRPVDQRDLLRCERMHHRGLLALVERFVDRRLVLDARRELGVASQEARVEVAAALRLDGPQQTLQRLVHATERDVGHETTQSHERRQVEVVAVVERDDDAVVTDARDHAVADRGPVGRVDSDYVAWGKAVGRQRAAAARLQRRVQRAAEPGLQVGDLEPPQQHAALLQFGFAARTEKALLLRDLLGSFLAQEFLVEGDERGEVQGRQGAARRAEGQTGQPRRGRAIAWETGHGARTPLRVSIRDRGRLLGPPGCRMRSHPALGRLSPPLTPCDFPPSSPH